MTDKRGMQARRERRLGRELELRRINAIYTLEVLEDNEDKEEDPNT